MKNSAIFILLLALAFALHAQNNPETKIEKKEKYTIKIRENKDGKTEIIDTTFNTREEMEAFMMAKGRPMPQMGQNTEPGQHKVILMNKSIEKSGPDSAHILTKEFADSNVFILSGSDSVEFGDIKVIHKISPGKTDVHVEHLGDKQLVIIESDSSVHPLQQIREIYIHINTQLEDMDEKGMQLLYHGKKTKTLELEQFTISPNPATKSTSIVFHASQNNATLHIYDATGKLITEKQLSGTDGNFQYEMPLDGLNAGIYYLQIVQGKKCFTKKLVVN